MMLNNTYSKLVFEPLLFKEHLQCSVFIVVKLQVVMKIICPRNTPTAKADIQR